MTRRSRIRRRIVHITLPADHPYASLMAAAVEVLTPPPAGPREPAPRVLDPEGGTR